MTEEELSVVVVTQLGAMWDANPVPGDPRGGRVFSRWTDRSPDDPGWDDWTLTAPVRDGRLDGEVPGWFRERVDPALAAGGAAGRFTVGLYLTVWWCRADRAGPGAAPPEAEEDDE